jgi:D-alanyl-lipoteichoic acid acyltransferase DltB (MBOAT superfamily)
VFEAPERYSSVEVLAGVYGYALQIYLDFSAYSDIAIGSAMILGFALPENFRTPYRSANLQEFWRRWHISLSTWLRDYLYVTLGGNRGSPARTYVNLIATMLLGGLWHGASWAFIVWGGLHGFGLAITRFFQRAAGHVARRFFVGCALAFALGMLLLRVLPDLGAWPSLVLGWAFTAPLWAVITAWLGRARAAAPSPREASPPPVRPEVRRVVEALRIAMCAAGVGFLAALKYAAEWTWIPLVLLTWGLAFAADVVERGATDLEVRAVAMLRRVAAALLLFHYVCFAWIFFRAPSLDGALAVLGQLGKWETDHPNLVPIVTVALTVGFACHFFAEGSLRWLRERFVALPAAGQGVVLAAAALVLRELGQPKLVPFIYFQF